jgi:hypothetical protein
MALNHKDKQLLYQQMLCLVEIMEVKIPITLLFINVPGAFGRHTWDDVEHSSQIALSPRFSADRLTLTLIHELAHVKQWQDGHFKRYGNFSISYKGKYYREYEKIPHSERPWEIDAYETQRKVMEDLKIS